MYIVRSSSWRCSPDDFTRVGEFSPRLLLDGLPAVWGRPPRVHQVAGVPVGFERLLSRVKGKPIATGVAEVRGQGFLSSKKC